MAGAVCTRAYRLPEDMTILDEVDLPVWIATYDPELVRFLWCNQANAKLWRKGSVEEFVGIDLHTNRSDAVIKVMTEQFVRVQVLLYPRQGTASRLCSSPPP